MGDSRTIELHQTICSPRSRVAVGYCRRSTDLQEQSITDQQFAITRTCTSQNLQLARFYIDDAVSGTSTHGRNAFKQMIADAKRASCNFSRVVVYDVKRFGRGDNDETGYYRHLLRLHGVEVVYCTENFTGDRTDDLIRSVKQWQAREESRDLAKVSIRGLLSRVYAPRPYDNSHRPGGWWIGGAPPFGYDLRYESYGGEFLFLLRYRADGSKQMLDPVQTLLRTISKGDSIKSSRRDRCRLVPGEVAHVKLVQRIFDMYIEECRGYASIADALNAEKIPSPRNQGWCSMYSGQWCVNTVARILRNPAYVGDMVWNRCTDARFYKIVKCAAVERTEGATVRTTVMNDPSDWIVVPEAHEPLISRRVYEMARQIHRQNCKSGPQHTEFAERTPAGRRQPAAAWVGQRAKFLLSGFLTCSRCGSRYEGRAHYGSRRSDGTRNRTYVYGCGAYIHHGRKGCTLGAVRQDLLESTVIDSVVAFYREFIGKSAKLRIKQALEVHGNHQDEELERRRGDLHRMAARIDKTVRNLVDNITEVNREIVDSRLIELRAQRRAMESELAALEHLSLSKMESEAIVEETIAFAESLPTSLRSSLPDVRSIALRRCIVTAQVDVAAGVARLDIRTIPFLGIGAHRTVTRVASFVRKPDLIM